MACEPGLPTHIVPHCSNNKSARTCLSAIDIHPASPSPTSALPVPGKSCLAVCSTTTLTGRPSARRAVRARVRIACAPREATKAAHAAHAVPGVVLDARGALVWDAHVWGGAKATPRGNGRTSAIDAGNLSLIDWKPSVSVKAWLTMHGKQMS